MIELPSDYGRIPDDLRSRLISPALLIVMPSVRENIRTVLTMTGGPDRWRPHVKTTKIPRIWAELVAAGVHHFKCATVREARVLGRLLHDSEVAGDVLVAHPVTGPGLAMLADLADRYPDIRFSTLCEEPDAAASTPRGIGLFLDVNPGMNRTGVPIDEGARIGATAKAAAGRLRGVHYYDGHMSAHAPGERVAIAHAGYERLIELVDALHRRGHAVGEIITSGTPALPAALSFGPFRRRDEATASIHRVSPGTVVFHDLRSMSENPDIALRPAALVFSRVVSHPTASIVTCDAGSKSIAAEAGNPCAVALHRPSLEALTPSEEHLPFRVTSGEPPARGAELILVPRHVCPTVNLAEQAVLLETDRAWELVDVAARAHDAVIDLSGE
jgi:D-serine deaminase-like pyridoxal phosphate-dependent protein